MEPGTAQGGRYALKNVLDYIRQVEDAYGLSLKFWLDIREAAEGHVALYVMVWGSGDILDLVPHGVQPPRARVWSDGDGDVLQALYYAAKRMEVLMRNTREPIGPPPALRPA